MVSELGQLLGVDGTGLGSIVGQDDDLLLPAHEVVNELGRAGDDVVSEPENTISIEDEGVDVVADFLEAFRVQRLGEASRLDGGLTFHMELYLVSLLGESSDDHFSGKRLVANGELEGEKRELGEWTG